jgi:hypothetical protein
MQCVDHGRQQQPDVGMHPCGAAQGAVLILHLCDGAAYLLFHARKTFF